MKVEPDLTLQSLLNLHESYLEEPNAIQESLWDGVFLNISPIARQVRKELVTSTFKLTQPRTLQEKDLYYQQAIFILPFQFQEKILYYKDTVSPIVFLLEKFPNLKNLDIRKIHSPRNITNENRILHEAIHLLTFEKYFNDSLSYKFDSNFTESKTAHWMLVHLAIEASVLATELMSTIVRPSFANIFIAHSSCHQAAAHTQDYNVLLPAQRQLGMKGLHMLLARGFLLANLVLENKKITEEFIDVVLEPWKEYPSCRAVVDRCLTLGEGFRKHSNSRYFSSLGFEYEYSDLPSLYYKDFFDKHPVVQDIFEFNFQRFVAPTL